MKPKYWSSGSGRIELPLYRREYMSVPMSGPADDAIAALMTDERIMRRFDKWSDELLAEELRGYGAWDNEEPSIRVDNIARILWIACLDIQEGR